MMSYATTLQLSDTRLMQMLHAGVYALQGSSKYNYLLFSYQVNHVFGRYPGTITVGGDLQGSHAHYSKGTGIPWLQAQHEQMQVGADSTY